jgi:hypothetical protein
MKGYGSQALFTPIRRRLVAWTMLILGSILVLLGASVYVTMSRSLMDQVDRNLVGHGPGRPPDHEGYRGGPLRWPSAPTAACWPTRSRCRWPA